MNKLYLNTKRGRARNNWYKQRTKSTLTYIQGARHHWERNIISYTRALHNPQQQKNIPHTCSRLIKIS